MLTYAFDLLYAIYEEEGYPPSQIPSLILKNNLYGAEIDERAGSLAAFALTMKAAAKRKLLLKDPVEPNVCVLRPISFDATELSFLVTSDGDRTAEEEFWNQFANADTFGTLIRPNAALTARLSNHLESITDTDIFSSDLTRATLVPHTLPSFDELRMLMWFAFLCYALDGRIRQQRGTLLEFVDDLHRRVADGGDALWVCTLSRLSRLVG